MKYSIKVKPLKDDGKAVIEISFKDFAVNDFIKGCDLLATENNGDILNKNIISDNNIILEVKYTAQQNFLKQLEENIQQYPDMEVESKQILIEKLGGWFDF